MSYTCCFMLSYWWARVEITFLLRHGIFLKICGIRDWYIPYASSWIHSMNEPPLDPPVKRHKQLIWNNFTLIHYNHKANLRKCKLIGCSENEILVVGHQLRSGSEDQDVCFIHRSKRLGGQLVLENPALWYPSQPTCINSFLNLSCSVLKLLRFHHCI